MQVTAKKRQPEKRREAQPKPRAETHTFPAPTRGWVLNENLAAVGPGSAVILDNWICTTTGISPRGGVARYANCGAPVVSMHRYTAGIIDKMFAATSDSVFDVSLIVDPEVVPTAEFTGQSGGEYTSQPFGTSGGDFLYLVNGLDDARLYDGSAWTVVNGASTPAITGVSTALLSHVWAYASRMFFIEGGTMTAWYLPVDSIGGAAASFSLAGVFKLGGSLLFGATWSMDAGDGLDDKCVFVSTEGEVAIYEGTNPGSASEWRLAGIYQITRPLGKNAYMRAGGDLLIATASGLVPMSAAIQKDVAALSMSAVSAPIAPYWLESVRKYNNPWEIEKWPEKNILLVSATSAVDDGYTLSCNLQTGAWSRWTNIGARCFEHFGGFVYAGGNDGYIRKLETGGSDMGVPYTCVYVGNHEGLAAPGMQKTVGQARALFRAGHEINPLVSAQVNYSVDVAMAPNSVADFNTGLWDSGLWDEATWDGSDGVGAVASNWTAVGRTGYAIAPEVQLTFGVTPVPNVELVSVDVTYYVGELVT